MKKILIIGDSFVQYHGPESNLSERYAKETWTKMINDNIKNYDVIIDGQSSRDVQTIIDKWILSIPKLKSDDILIICLPTFYRTRLPLKKSRWYGYKIGEYSFINKFVGANSYQEGDESIDSFNHSNFQLKEETINIYQVLNSTESAITNYLDVLNTLMKITPCSYYVFSWDSIKFEKYGIEDRKILIENIDYWETLHDVYKNTNGEDGVHGDFHWSKKMNKLFYTYLIENKLKNILK